MKLNIIISDADYRDLISKNRRIQGTIGLTSTKEATFNRHRQARRAQASDYRFRKLTHGRVSITNERVRLTLNIDRSESDICASDCIENESTLASDFVFNEIELDET
jgi:hypothetical protein